MAKTGDFNGDTHTDILWRHQGGAVAVWDIVNSQQAGYHFVADVGNDWHVADAGDFNGDRVERPAVEPRTPASSRSGT